MKFFLLLLVTCLTVAVGGAESRKKQKSGKSHEAAPDVLEIGHLSHPRLTESSGLVASRRYPQVFWTHNDGGGPKKQVLYGITREGKSIAEFHVIGALLEDWEDIALDADHHLFIGDVGNNDGKRDQVAVYEIDEPDPKSSRAFVTVKRGWQLRFPQAPFDCESLFVWNGYGYMVSKVFNDERAEIYRFPLTEQKDPITLESVGRLRIDSPVTGADISADGGLLGLVAKSGAFVYRINGDVAKAASMKPFHTKFKHEHIEGCCFVAEGLMATAESREIFLFTNEAFRPAR